ncbi:transporter substrate-binding domain-containing protein [Aeromonas hydrophila]|uniref:substrate-binding periplasmic protein n=1 Tax=Aeromonas hydrophila TaxID=644 RepID=UPI0022AF101F|nr:transporter substrate-binding domain-containing protein [Aeromonas hydrophila]MCZ4335690.1 transporter substrate-binding domain-containing protein [Aeromonas hydrophila]
MITRFFIFLILLFSFPSISFCYISIGVDDWPPYVKMDSSGLIDRKVSCLLDKIGIVPIYKKYPWPRIYKMIKRGELDMSYPWAKTPQRSREVLFSYPILYDKEVFIYLSSNPIKWRVLSDLSNYRVGAQIGYSHVELLERNSVIPAVQVRTESQLMGMLFSKRIDVFPINLAVLEKLISSLSDEQASQLKISEFVLSENSMHLIFSNNNKGREIMNMINQIITSGVCGKIALTAPSKGFW